MTEYESDEAVNDEAGIKGGFEPAGNSRVEQSDTKEPPEHTTDDAQRQFIRESVRVGRYADIGEPAVSGSGD